MYQCLHFFSVVQYLICLKCKTVKSSAKSKIQSYIQGLSFTEAEKVHRKYNSDVAKARDEQFRQFTTSRLVLFRLSLNYSLPLLTAWIQFNLILIFYFNFIPGWGHVSEWSGNIFLINKILFWTRNQRTTSSLHLIKMTS